MREGETFGSGLGEDTRGMYMAIVLVHKNADDAEENVSLLEQRIDTTVSVYTGQSWKQWILDTEIHAEGEVLWAKLYTPVSRFWSDWYYNGDSLLLYED